MTAKEDSEVVKLQIHNSEKTTQHTKKFRAVNWNNEIELHCFKSKKITILTNHVVWENPIEEQFNLSISKALSEDIRSYSQHKLIAVFLSSLFISPLSLSLLHLFFICFSIYLTVWLTVCHSICVSDCLPLPLYLCVCLCLCICVSLCLYVCPSTH